MAAGGEVGGGDVAGDGDGTSRRQGEGQGEEDGGSKSHTTIVLGVAGGGKAGLCLPGESRCLTNPADVGHDESRVGLHTRL